MLLIYAMRKRSVLTLFLIAILVSSCSPQCHQWQFAVIKADCPSAQYVKIYLPPCNTFNGLEAVFMRYNGTTAFYLNVFTLLFPINEGDEEHTDVTFCIEESTYTFTAERLLGGQRLLLPDEATQLALETLIENKTIEVTVGRYQTTLIPDNFVRCATR